MSYVSIYVHNTCVHALSLCPDTPEMLQGLECNIAPFKNSVLSPVTLTGNMISVFYTEFIYIL